MVLGLNTSRPRLAGEYVEYSRGSQWTHTLDAQGLPWGVVKLYTLV